ncbi:MAG TPA: FAD-dependent oxidoreductase, partial [Thermoleophilaceae bacterium]|nr:FAD-dependent oxidoreductase [Thermoleophilaceae bacterium]
GFYYKTFIRPRRLWPLYEKVLRNAAGLGRIADTDRRKKRFDKVHRHVDVLVIGGGHSGLEAATAAAREGKDTLLVDEGLAIGGRLAHGGPEKAERAASLAQQAREAGVEILAPAFAGGLYEGNLVPVYHGDVMHRVRAREVVVATGRIEQPLVFSGNDLPGVMLAEGARRLLHQFRLAPGRKAVVVAADDEGLSVADELGAAGIEVVASADLRRGEKVLHAGGWGKIRSVVLERDGRTERHHCDLLIASGGHVADVALLRQGGGTLRYDPDRATFVADQVPAGVRLASTALAAAARVPCKAKDVRGKQFVCFCEDVTTKDIALSAQEGFDSLELAKRYTTVTMGPCQGRMCQRNSALVLAEEIDADPDDRQVGITTARPPHAPTRFALLAGRGHQPERRTPLHDWNVANGGDMAWAGDWKRAYHYGEAGEEVEAIHERVGLIDVSPLGKLLVRGPDAAEFLERIYPNRFGNLGQGRVRYGVVCGEDGAILDDGTVVRLSDEEFYVTTTSSGSSGMDQWFTWWNAVWQLDCEIVNVTPALGAVNLAGPAAREVLGALTDDIDVSNEAFPYLGARTGLVAGVPSLIMRIGFVGELGYEIHHPAACAEHLWTKLLEQGAAREPRAAGLEAQRRLRLEKLHVIVSQDTDAESNPLEAAMPWIVKLDKEQDWIGKRSLEYVTERGLREALVGFTGRNGAVPLEGAAVVDSNGEPAGRVTSS